MAKDNKVLCEMRTFAKYLLRQFFDCAAKNPKVFMEICFWKSANEASEVADGSYDESRGAKTARQKAAHWSEEDEEKLERVFQ